MKPKTLVSAALIVLAIAAAGIGQENKLVVIVEFPFAVGDKTLPAGEYQFILDPTATAFRLTDGKKSLALIPIITRIARQPFAGQPNAYLAFDVVQGVSFLSEIWFPGDDGYVVSMTKEDHAHRIVALKR